MASGHVNRTYRPNTWLHRPTLQTRRKSLPTRSRPHMAQSRYGAMSDLSPLCAPKRTSVAAHAALSRFGQRNTLGRVSTHRHIPRIRAPTLMRTPWLAARAGIPTATGGQLVLSNRPSMRRKEDRRKPAWTHLIAATSSRESGVRRLASSKMMVVRRAAGPEQMLARRPAVSERMRVRRAAALKQPSEPCRPLPMFPADY